MRRVLSRNPYLLTRTSADGETLIVGAADPKGLDCAGVATRKENSGGDLRQPGSVLTWRQHVTNAAYGMPKPEHSALSLIRCTQGTSLLQIAGKHWHIRGLVKVSRSFSTVEARCGNLVMYPLQRLWHLPLDMWNKLPMRIDLPIPYLQIDIVFVNDPGQIKVECPLSGSLTSGLRIYESMILRRASS